LLDTSRYFTPAHFTINGGNKIVHAPSNHDLQITKPVNTIYGLDNVFLDIEDMTTLKLDSGKVNEDNIEDHIQEHMNNIYSFLKQ
jgi:hypothetical protein